MNSTLLEALCKEYRNMSAEIERLTDGLQALSEFIIKSGGTIPGTPVAPPRAKPQLTPNVWPANGSYSEKILFILRNASNPMSSEDIAIALRQYHKKLPLSYLRPVASKNAYALEKRGLILSKREENQSIRYYIKPA